jgi:hypothetical protein
MVTKSSAQWKGRSTAACMVARPGEAGMAKSEAVSRRRMLTVCVAHSGQSIFGTGAR